MPHERDLLRPERHQLPWLDPVGLRFAVLQAVVQATERVEIASNPQ